MVDKIDGALARRIAQTYCEKYTKVGFAAASEYVERTVGDNPVHIAQVRELVVQMLAPIYTPPTRK